MCFLYYNTGVTVDAFFMPGIRSSVLSWFYDTSACLLVQFSAVPGRLISVVDQNQWFRFSRHIGWVTPKISYLYDPRKHS